MSRGGRELQKMSSLDRFPETADIETSSADYAVRFSGAIGEWFLSVQQEATLRMLAPHPNAHILDVGGGHGQLMPALIREGYNVTVLGSAPSCEDRIKPWVEAGRCSFVLGNILDLPYPDRTFDVVISYRLLPHVTEWRRFLSELARVARIAVLVDYPATRSVNSVAPLLFGWKKHVEGNTRPFACFRESEPLAVFRSVGYELADRYPEFSFPMVLHRVMRAPRISAGMEALARSSGLTRVLGSPVILKLIRLTPATT